MRHPLNNIVASLSPKAGMVDVFIEAFIKDFNNQSKIKNTQRSNIISEIDALNKRYQNILLEKNALLKNVDGEMADDDFQEVKKLTKGQIDKLERQLNDLAVVGSEIKDLISSESAAQDNTGQTFYPTYRVMTDGFW